MDKNFYKSTSAFIKNLYPNKDSIPLHEPSFSKIDKNYLNNAIESTFVSSIGKYIEEFESRTATFTKSPFALAVVNGTSAIHLALRMAEVEQDDIVITQSLTFVATVNAIKYQKATPLFLDVSKDRMSLCPNQLELFLNENALVDNNVCKITDSNRIIKALIVVHTFGHPAELDEIKRICNDWNIILIEDAAESLGSFYKEKHTGTYGSYGVLSFNGNKIITTGGGGVLLCNNVDNGKLARHIATTAKARSLDFYHDEIGYNYRMPNINAALGCAQFESLEKYIKSKRILALEYKNFFEKSDFIYFKEPKDSKSNYWLNTVLAPSKKEKDEFIKYSNNLGIMTRPGWYLMHKLPIFKDSLKSNLKNTEWLSDRIINLPSSPIVKK